MTAPDLDTLEALKQFSAPQSNAIQTLHECDEAIAQVQRFTDELEMLLLNLLLYRQMPLISPSSEIASPK